MAPGAPDWIAALRGQFITFEGIDGCGKSTQAERLVSRLRGYGLPVLHTREPGGTPIGAALRAVLLSEAHGEMIPHCELLLYLADRVQHLAQAIRPALGRGETVVCDRYHDATEAYQRYGRELNFAPVQAFIAETIAPTPPRLTLWLDLPVPAAQRRIAGRELAQPVLPGTVTQGRMDGESAAFHERVRAGYQALYEAHRERIVRIDAAPPADAVAAAVWAAVGERFHEP